MPDIPPHANKAAEAAWLIQQTPHDPKIRERAARILVPHYTPKLQKYLIQHCRCNPEAAEDLVQEALFKFFQNPPQPGAAQSWLYTVVRNGFIDRTRTKGPDGLKPNTESIHHSDDDDAEPPFFEALVDAEADPAKQAEAFQRVSRSWRLFSDKHASYTRIIEMSCFDGLSHEEAADALKISYSAYKARLSEALRLFNAILAQH